MGDGYASPIIGGAGTLIRDNIRSRNYVAGASGWAIFANGFAEFLDLVIRGKFSTGVAPSPRVEIADDPAPPFGGIPRIALYSGDPQETTPALLANFVNAGLSWLELDTSNDGFGVNQLIALAPQAAAPGGFVFATTETSGGPDIAHVEVDTDMGLRVLNPNNVTLASRDHGLQVGPDAGFNLAVSDAQIQSRNNFAVAGLLLNESGGNVQVGNFAGTGTLVAANNNGVALAATNNAFMIGADTALNTVMAPNVLQVRNNGAVATLAVQPLGGNIAVGPAGAGNVTIFQNTNPNALGTTANPVMVGANTAQNLIADRQGLQSRNTGAAAALLLNALGGNVQAGFIGGTGTLVALNDNSVALGSTNNGFMIGTSTGLNLVADREQLQVRNNGAASILGLNTFGGDILMFGVTPATLQINGDYIAPAMRSVSASDPNVRTTSSNTFVLAAGTAAISMVAPPSGTITVNVDARLANNGPLATDYTVVSFQVRNGTAAGAILAGGAASDLRGAVMSGAASIGSQLSVSKTVSFAPGTAASGTYYIEPVVRVSNAATSGSYSQLVLTARPEP